MNKVFRFHKATTARIHDAIPNLILRMDLERDETKPPNYQGQGERLAGLLLETMPTATLLSMVETLTAKLSNGE